MLVKEIRQKISEYLSEALSLRQFQEWFVPATWDIHQAGIQEEVLLTGKVELWLAELTSGHLTEDELKYEMRRFLNEPIMIITGSSTQTISRQIIFGTPTITSQFVATLDEVEHV